MLPVLHFSGKFRFAMPGRNNDPRAPGVPFDADLPASNVDDPGRMPRSGDLPVGLAVLQR